MLILLDTDTRAIELDPICAETRACGLIKQHLQATAMDADLRKRIARKFAARLAVYELAKAIIETALAILDSRGKQFVLQPKRSEFAHAVRQQGNADAELLHLWRAFDDAAGNPALVQVQRQHEAANAPAENENLVHRAASMARSSRADRALLK